MLRTRVFLFLLLLSFIATFAGAQSSRPGPGGTTVPAAPPDGSAPVAERVGWLTANPDHVAVADVFSDVLDDAKSVADLDRIRQDVVPNLVDQELKLDGTRRLATVYRTARQLGTAGTLYRQAYDLSHGSDLHSLFAHALILFELGEFVPADSEARAIVARTTDYSLKRRAYTLSARIAYEEGMSEQAIEMLETLASLASAEETPSELVEVETLLLMSQIFQLSDDQIGMARIDSLLLRLFPDSVAAEIVHDQSRLLSLPGLPSALLLSHRDIPENQAGRVAGQPAIDPPAVRRAPAPRPC